MRPSYGSAPGVRRSDGRRSSDHASAASALAAASKVDCMHPTEPQMNSLYGTIFVDDSDNPQCHSKNICIFADGELDRSPTGTGVSARVAVENSRGNLNTGEKIYIETINLNT